jgi:hypothetical protein
MKFVDISGFGHSGKSAVTDYLKQYNCVLSFPNHVEFELIRVSGGLLDLYFSIYESWNLIRSTVRLNEFKALVNRIGTTQSTSNPISYFTASGHGYEKLFNYKFIEISNKFIDRIITGKQRTFWPYENLRVNPILVFFNKFKAKFFNSLLTSEIYFSDRNDFLSHTEVYMKELFKEIVETHHTHFLLSNAFEPFNPKPCLDMVGDAFAIIVDRDPRDIYASQINANDVFIPNFEQDKKIESIKKLMTGFGDIDHFIFRYKTLKENVINKSDCRIINVNYEDFVLNHESCAKTIKSIIGISEKEHLINDGFDVSRSVKNVGLWKKYADLPEIKKIEDQLGQFCHNY